MQKIQIKKQGGILSQTQSQLQNRKEDFFAPQPFTQQFNEDIDSQSNDQQLNDSVDLYQKRQPIKKKIQKQPLQKSQNRQPSKQSQKVVNGKKKSKIALKNRWQKDYTLKSISFPEEIKNPIFKSRFETTLTYLDENKKQRRQKIRFGVKGQKYFIDPPHDQEQANLLNLKLAKVNKNFFLPNFWVLVLLNQTEKLSDAYYNFQKQFLQH